MISFMLVAGQVFLFYIFSSSLTACLAPALVPLIVGVVVLSLF